MKFLFFLVPTLLFAEMNLDHDSILANELKGIAILENDSVLPWFCKGVCTSCPYIPGGFDNLKGSLLPYLGQPLTLDLIADIKQAISNYYRSYFHPLTTIQAPEQDVTDGYLKLIVIESRLGEIRSSGNRWFSDSLLFKPIRIHPGETLIADVLIEDVAFLNRNPFRYTDIIFSPGQEPNTTDIDLYTHDRFPVRFYGGGDNTGTRITGRPRWFAGLDWAWTAFVDQILSYQYTTSSDLHEFHSHTGHYTCYLPWHHVLLLYGGFSKTRPHIPDFRSEGYFAQGSLRYQIPKPIFFTALHLQPVIGVDYKLEKTNLIFVGENEIPVSKGFAAVSQAVFGAELAWENAYHKVLFQGLLYWSPGDILPHQTFEDYNALQPGADPNYLYTTLTFSYRYDSEHFTLYYQARGQASTQTLLSSEQFVLGGYDTVRGYDELEFLSDDGVCLNLELRSTNWSLFPCRKIRDDWTFLIFWDTGFGFNTRKEVDLPKNGFLMGVGPGIRFAIFPYLTVRCDYGIKLHKLHLGDNTFGKLHVGAILSY